MKNLTYSFCLGLLAFFIQTSLSSAEEHGGAPAENWYRDSWIHSHVSIGFQPSELDFVAHQIEVASVDAVQFHVHNLDMWDAMRKTGFSKKVNAKIVSTINWAGGWRPSHGYDKDPAYIYRVHPDGSIAGRWEAKHLCFNAPVVRERIIPEKYGKLPARLKPDQVWIDENIVTVNLCWCQHCKRLYREEYGVEAPTKLTADNYAEWTQWTTFHRKSFERWMADVYKEVNRAIPGTLVTFNHAWFVDQPETPPPFIRNLSADIHRHPLELGIYARYGGSGTLPFDIMPGLGSDRWAGVVPKTLDTVLNDVALIIAHGGRWNIGEYPTNDARKKRPAETYIDLAKQGAHFARVRQEFCQHTKPIPYVALLHSASTHYDHVIRNFNGLTPQDGYGISTDGDFRKNTGKPNSRIYWPNNHYAARSVIGAYQALVENQIHFNFTIEDRLSEDLKHVTLLVLPEQHRLSPSSVVAIKDYVNKGGLLLATGSTRHAGLDDILNYKSEKPNKVGKGQSLYLPDDIFGVYYMFSGYSSVYKKNKSRHAARRKHASEIFNTLLEKRPTPYILKYAPPSMEWTVRKSEAGDALLVHLINRQTEWGYDRDAPTQKLQMAIASKVRPSAVTLEPGGDVIKWSWRKAELSLELDPEAVPHHRIIRIAYKGK